MAKTIKPEDEPKDDPKSNPAASSDAAFDTLTDDSGAKKKADETVVGGFYIVEGVAVDCNGKPIS